MFTSLQNPLALASRLLMAALFLPASIGKITGFAGTVGYISSVGLPMPTVAAAVAAAVEVLGALESIPAHTGNAMFVLDPDGVRRGPRTDAAGFAGMTWPITSQSNRWRTPASCCLTLGAASSRPSASTQAATWSGCTPASEATPRASHQARKSPAARA